jgi:hypothetical protein
VRGLATNPNIAVASGIGSMIYRYTYGYIVATAAIVCLDSRLRWEYVEYSVATKEYIDILTPNIFLDDTKVENPLDPTAKEIFKQKIILI